MLNKILFAAHHLIASQIPTIHWMILKNQQMRRSEGISTLLLISGLQGKLMSSGSCGGAVFTNCSCSCPPHGNVSQFGVWTAWTRQGTVETADSRLCTGEIKWIGPASLEWEKLHGGIPLHKIYILDTQEKTDLKNTRRFLLSHGKNSEALK